MVKSFSLLIYVIVDIDSNFHMAMCVRERKSLEEEKLTLDDHN